MLDCLQKMIRRENSTKVTNRYEKYVWNGMKFVFR